MIANDPGIHHNRNMNVVPAQAPVLLQMRAPPLILASASKVRAAVLRGAGLEFRVQPAMVDEAEFKTAARADGADATAVAAGLAALKATRLSHREPAALVIGADQMLSCDGDWLDKPPGLAEARGQLLRLRGRTHMLHCAACVARDGAVIWRRAETARLTMRDFSEEFLDVYLAAAGDAVCASVGAYQLEGLGAHLFARIDGDYFTILGLPLLPLLDFLRQHRLLAA